ncbi:MAG: serine hydrolase domain-containing protein [Balneolaceae bacterium]|nr:serine hydrolase domain-containing protein [Balneolaceae bacterium]
MLRSTWDEKWILTYLVATAMKKVFVLVFLFAGLISTCGLAQPALTDSTELISFLDGTIEAYMDEYDQAGATVVITQNGEPIALRGYGYADIENLRTVDPRQSLFRIGSISKLFVWIAIMQQVEAGNLDLNTDINQYLDEITIPETYPEPITLKHLMTHTAGFEEYVTGLFARDSTRLRPLEDILMEELPARVRPPGRYASYSNHGTGLAAHILEQVTGIEFQDYVRQNIFAPLNMNAVTFRQPPRGPLARQLSRGYDYENGEFVEKSFEYVPLGPVGAASATATGLIPFMQAHLNVGTYNGVTLIDSATARLMHSPAFSHADGVNPMRYGFIDMSQNGVEIFGHGGNTLWFHSMMALFPEQDLGFFLSFNSADGSSLPAKVLQAFVDRYFPVDSVSIEPMPVDSLYLQEFTGNYRANRYPHERLTKIMALFDPLEVSLTEDMTLKTYNGQEGRFWVPQDSLLFREVKTGASLAFEKDRSGRVTHLFLDDLPIIAFEKIPTISSQFLHYSIFGVTTTALGIVVLYWPFAYLVRQKYRASLTVREPLPFHIKLAGWANSQLLIGFYIAVGLFLGGPENVVYGLATSLKFMLIIPLISLLLTLYMTYLLVQIWKYSMSGLWSRVSYTLLTIVFYIALWQLYYWNLLGFKY